MKSNLETYIKWFEDNKAYLKIDKIEKDIECPPTTIAKYVKEERSLPDKWHTPLADWIKNFIKLKR